MQAIAREWFKLFFSVDYLLQTRLIPAPLSVGFKHPLNLVPDPPENHQLLLP